jgi:flagellar basal body P-ring protein FlgI
LVVGLGKNGSRDCPEPLRAQMVQEISKRLETGGVYSSDQIKLSAKGLLESLDTTVVEVSGSIPPGACKGTRFDVQVQAVAGTDTRSLEGGRLYTCSLHIFRFDSQGSGIRGKAVATAAGPSFRTSWPAAAGRRRSPTRVRA